MKNPIRKLIVVAILTITAIYVLAFILFGVRI